MKEILDRNERSAVGVCVSQMERDVLEAAYHHGAIMKVADGSMFPQYVSDDERSIKQVEIVIDYLVEERFLFPFIRRTSSHQTVIVGLAGGITPKGISRLWELRYPRRTWFEKNWFAATVAVAAFLTGVGSILVNVFV